jgi:hypothetical protein
VLAGTALLSARTTQERPHSCDQLPHAERFRQVVVGAALEPDDFVVLLALGSQHQDRYIGVRAFAPDGAAHRDTVDLRQHQIEHDDIEGVRARQLER